MKKNISTLVITLVCITLTSVVVIGLLIKNNIISKDNILFNFFQEEHKSNTNNNSAHMQESFKYPVLKVFLEEGAKYAIQYSEANHKKEKYSDILIKFNKLTITKEKGEFVCPDNYMEIKDEKGYIINNYSYIVANISLTNKGIRDYEVSLNSIYLFLDDDSTTRCELRSINTNKSYKQKDFFFVNLVANKEYNFNLVFIEEDSMIQGKMKNALLLSDFTGIRTNEKIPIIKK